MDLAHVGVKDAAVAVYQVAGLLGTALGTGGDGQLRVIPDGDLQDIADAHFVVVIFRRVREGVR